MSITHQHHLAMIRQEMGDKKGVRILDVGCYRGEMLELLQSELPGCEVCGVDFDVWAGAGNTLNQTRARLAKRFPDIDWNERVRLTSDYQNPFPSQFDFVITNQVLEHVADLPSMFRFIRGALKPEGVSLNLFPLKHVWWEDHCKCFFAHRVPDRFRPQFLSMVSRITGRGPAWANEWAEKLKIDPSYRSIREVRMLAKEAGLSSSFNYTFALYWLRLFSLFGRRPKKMPEISLTWALKYIASVCVVLRCIKG